MEEYGGWQMRATRVLSVNGDVDPWSSLAITSEDGGTDDLPTIWVEGASHHFWTHELKETDSLNVKNARLMIYDQVVAWLDE